MVELTALVDAPFISVVEGYKITDLLLDELQCEISRMLPGKGWKLRHWSEWYGDDGVFHRR